MARPGEVELRQSRKWLRGAPRAGPASSEFMVEDGPALLAEPG